MVILKRLITMSLEQAILQFVIKLCIMLLEELDQRWLQMLQSRVFLDLFDFCGWQGHELGVRDIQAQSAVLYVVEVICLRNLVHDGHHFVEVVLALEVLLHVITFHQFLFHLGVKAEVEYFLTLVGGVERISRMKSCIEVTVVLITNVLQNRRLPKGFKNVDLMKKPFVRG